MTTRRLLQQRESQAMVAMDNVEILAGRIRRLLAHARRTALINTRSQAGDTR